jgi:biotin operon repressor
MEQRNKRWTQSEDQILFDAIKTGKHTTQELSKILGRSEKGIWARTKHLKKQGVLEDRKYVARKMGEVKAWTSDEDNILWMAYFMDNLTLEQIGAVLGRSLGSVKNRLEMLRKEYNARTDRP